MLTGLFFLGVLAATAMPDVMEVLRGSAEDDTGPDKPDDTASDPVDSAGSLLDDVDSDDPALDIADDPDDADIDEDADDVGVDLFVEPSPGTILVEAFAPEVDTLTIVVPDGAQDFAAATDGGSGASSLSYTTEDGVVELRFDGLSDVPVDDIFLRVSDASSPTQDSDIGLGFVMQKATVPSDPAESPVLFAVDPELSEEPALPLDDDLPVLMPDDPVIDEGAGPLAPVPGPVLDPVLDDIAPDPIVEAQVLSPAMDDGNVGVQTSGDAAPQGAAKAETDEITPNMADVGLAPTAVESGHPAGMQDLTAAARDVVQPGTVMLAGQNAPPPGSMTDPSEAQPVLSDVSAGAGDALLEVAKSPDGMDGLVRIDGVAVAILRGALDAGPD